MPGYATTGATIDGQAGTAFARNVGTSEVTIFTATVKTRLNICTVTNQIKTTLPIRIYIKDVSGNTYDVVRNLRVTNQIIAWHYLVQPSSPVFGTLSEDSMPTGVVLQAGQSICAISNYPNAFDVVIDLSTGVQ